MSIDDEILACESQLRLAQLSGDAEALERLLDDALVFTSFDGTLASKTDDLAMHRSGKLRITKMDPVERRVLHLGETSVVSVLMKAEAILEGSLVSANMRYTRVWHRRTDGWRIVAGHMSALPS